MLWAANLKNIGWRANAHWEKVRSLEKTSNIPPKLLEQLKMNEK
jgi:hypothetical protein